MKKLIAFAAVAGMAALASCGDAAAEAKRILDSTNAADSMANVQHMADSAKAADSMKMAADAEAAKMKAHDDSVKADSIAKAGDKKKK